MKEENGQYVLMAMAIGDSLVAHVRDLAMETKVGGINCWGDMKDWMLDLDDG